ncbi:hypothetical protein G7054_g7744 [Neopestalotiopsis clavispora]|nr:hypothetical protein G7054_g7744 [Neopestalotiopsis clavispora]
MPKVPAPAMVYGPDYAGVRNEQPRPVQPMMMRQSDEEMGLRGGGAGVSLIHPLPVSILYFENAREIEENMIPRLY